MQTSTRVREIGEKLRHLATLNDSFSQFKTRLDEAIATGKATFMDARDRSDKQIIVCLAERWASSVSGGGFQMWAELNAEDTGLMLLIFQRHVNRTLDEISKTVGELAAELETLK